MDQPKIERLLRLMKMLTGNVNYTVDDLADKLATSARSVYRYIDTFKEAGFVVHKEGNVYRLGKENRYFKDISQLIHFTDEEAYIVAKLLDGLDDNNLLKQNLRKKLASIYNVTSLAECVVSGKNAINVNAIIEAIETKKQVLLKNYASSNRADVCDRLVEPFAFTTNYVQIWCYDTQDDTNKLFKTARIEAVEILSQNWNSFEKHRVGYIDVFRMSSHNQFQVVLELGVMAHNLLLEEYPLAQRDVKQLGSDRWLLDTYVCDYAGVARFVIGLADDIKIVDSLELDLYIDNFTQSYLAK